MTEIKEIAVNMNFCEEKNQEQEKAFMNKINQDFNETGQITMESPMSSLAFQFGISTIATPKSHKNSPEMIEVAYNDEISNDKYEANSSNSPDMLIDQKDLISKIKCSAENSPIARNKSRRQIIAPQNINFDLKSDSPLKEDMSFYSSDRPFATLKMNGECLSQDSLRFESSNDIRGQITTPLLTFVESNSPKKGVVKASTNMNHSPTKYTVTSNSRLGNGFKVYESLSMGSNESTEIEDEYLELMEMENMDDETQMPSDLSSLLCKDVKNVQMCFNMDKSTENDSSRNSSSVPKLNRITSLCTTPERHCLATINENVASFGNNRAITAGAFKRPEPPTLSPNQSKRHKGDNDALIPSIVVPLSLQMKRPPLRKTVSMNDAATIMDALSRSTEDTDLIGDFSKRFCLPYTDGRHKDLRSISTETMRRLLLGEYDDFVKSYKIIDCRYPYEYEGGHIRGAVNLYTQEQIIENLINKKTDSIVDGDKRDILIFHCEFSSERGPKLSRFLRNHDRMSSPYPALQYPEIYLLHGGYKEFFQQNRDLCEPNAYRTMLDSDYSCEYKNFRAKSKSWTGDGRTSNRLSKSRSRLVL